MPGIFGCREAVFEQGKILSATYPPGSPLHGGICFSLVLTWISEFMVRPAGTAADRMAACRAEFLKSGARQSMYLDIGYGGARGKAQDAALNFLGLKSGGSHRRGDDFDALERLCTQPLYDKTFHEVGFYFEQGGGHSTALYVGPNALSFFDPNYGEFTFDWSKWKQFFDGLAGLYAAGPSPLTVNRVTTQQISRAQSLIERWQSRIDQAA